MAAGTSWMDRRLLEAATIGDATSMKYLERHAPGVLLGTTPKGNTCLHISSAQGHEEFCKDAMALEPSLLQAVNADGVTPLLSAVTGGHVSLAYFLLRCCRDLNLSTAAILTQDKDRCNALHYAIRCGHRELALELIAAEPALSHAVNRRNESSMFIAATRDFTDVCEKLLEIPDSAHSGVRGNNALHAAVRNNNSVIVKKIMKTRPFLAREEEMNGVSAVNRAALDGKTEVLRVMLEHDWSLGYDISSHGNPLLFSAAHRGRVDFARYLLSRCPDAPYCNMIDGSTILHHAVSSIQPEFVEFILGTPHLRELVNMQTDLGRTALDLAVEKCNPRMVAALLLHQDIDVTVLNNYGDTAAWSLSVSPDKVNTLNWNAVFMLMLQANPNDPESVYNIYKNAMDNVTDASRKDAKSFNQIYTSNTSVVAVLIATITFAAAFTLPGGYSSDTGSEGLPIMARKFAFQAFLICDTLAMCSSLSVAFICVIATWGNFVFLIYYRSFTKKLMWFAYMATTLAFATGLYTVLAPRLLWLAITICVLSVLLPIFTYLLGKWPILKFRIQLGGGTFKSDILDMV